VVHARGGKEKKEKAKMKGKGGKTKKHSPISSAERRGGEGGKKGTAL